MAAAAETSFPLPPAQLEDLVNKVCDEVFAEATSYDHPSCSSWNTTIINKSIATIRKGLGDDSKWKIIVNSIIAQQISSTESEGAAAAGRGMHYATGAFWNCATDGTWSHKWSGGKKGFEVVISVVWVQV